MPQFPVSHADMDKYKRVCLRLIDAVAAVPPLRLVAFVPFAVLLSLWTLLVQSGVEPGRGFVMIMVLGQAFVVWVNLPRAGLALHRPGRDRRDLLLWPVAATVALAALQLWASDPLVSQRLVSGACAFVLGVMLLGMCRQRAVLAHVGAGLRARRVSLMPVNAGMAALTLTVNEMLIAADKIGVWVAGMALYALAIHAIYWFIVLLVVPAEDSHA